MVAEKYGRLLSYNVVVNGFRRATAMEVHNALLSTWMVVRCGPGRRRTGIATPRVEPLGALKGRTGSETLSAAGTRQKIISRARCKRPANSGGCPLKLVPGLNHRSPPARRTS